MKAVKDVRSAYYSEKFSEIMNICGYEGSDENHFNF